MVGPFEASQRGWVILVNSAGTKAAFNALARNRGYVSDLTVAGVARTATVTVSRTRRFALTVFITSRTDTSMIEWTWLGYLAFSGRRISRMRSICVEAVLQATYTSFAPSRKAVRIPAEANVAICSGVFSPY